MTIDSVLELIHFNPPTPRGVGRHTVKALLTSLQFQSTHPSRGGTCNICIHNVVLQISIHPPLAGWDLYVSIATIRSVYFNPPTPRGVGLSSIRRMSLGRIFQSTHPSRGGTGTNGGITVTVYISIHPPLAGWDMKPSCKHLTLSLFQSTHPSRGGTSPSDALNPLFVISIHPPLAGWDG